ncbi:ABC transporter permease [Mangrovicoccus ximenensis]|uniref:ABC transporter permease n=1 Tax=Mangrovicoccus ximenensis TaxID=1911570 RepID=UPI000D3445B6|nr:ABC transporter permease [Mangrovicoccus ximenensis]
MRRVFLTAEARRPGAPPLVKLAETWLPGLLAWSLLAFLFVPMLVVVPVAFTDRSYLSMPADALSMQHFASLADPRDGWLASIGASLAIGLVSSLLCTAAAAAFSIGAWLHAGRWPSLLRVILLSPLIVPPIIYAVGMVRLWSSLSLLDTWAGTVIVHVILAMPLAVLAIGGSLGNLDPALVRAARSLGARPGTVVLRVILPNLKPGLAASALLSFIVSWDEITVTLFITSRSVVTLPRRIWTSINDNVDPAIAAIATLMLLATVLGLALRMAFRDRSRPPGAQR